MHYCNEVMIIMLVLDPLKFCNDFICVTDIILCEYTEKRICCFHSQVKAWLAEYALLLRWPRIPLALQGHLLAHDQIVIYQHLQILFYQAVLHLGIPQHLLGFVSPQMQSISLLLSFMRLLSAHLSSLSR